MVIDLINKQHFVGEGLWWLYGNFYLALSLTAITIELLQVEMRNLSSSQKEMVVMIILFSNMYKWKQ
jgi:hypothetical protein